VLIWLISTTNKRQSRNLIIDDTPAGIQLLFFLNSKTVSKSFYLGSFWSWSKELFFSINAGRGYDRCFGKGTLASISSAVRPKVVAGAGKTGST
jgi:hypothetical protein